MNEPLLSASVSGESLALAAAGSWTSDCAEHLEPLVESASRGERPVTSVAIDVANVERLDTYGAWLLERLVRAWTDNGSQASIVGLSDDYRELIREVHNANKTPVPPPWEGTPFHHALTVVNATTQNVILSLTLIVQMFGELAVTVGKVALRPHRFRFTSMVHHLDHVGWRAVPIVLLITFLIGAILAQQGIFHFRRFGADLFVVDLVGILILREVGVLIVCIMVAGRSGSAYTAELGSMKMREEIDALQTMGFNPVEVLILPRIAALVIAVPVLTFLGSISALSGGGLVAWLYAGISPQVFLARLHDAISMTHFVVGMVKAPFMALIIGIVACVEGLEVKGSAESLGRQTTSSVVKSIFLVIVLDGFFAIFFAATGM